MALNLTQSRLLESILESNPGLDFTFDNVVISAPIPTPVELQSKYPGNTLLRITANEASKFSGSVVISYNRLNMAEVALMWGPGWPIGPDLVNMHATLEALYKYRGVLRASPNSLAFFGEIDIDFLVGPAGISYAIPTTVLGEFTVHPANSMDAELYMYGITGDRFHEYLITVDALSDLAELAMHLTAITGNIWTADGDTGYTLKDAVIISNTLDAGTVHHLTVQLGGACYIKGNLILPYDTSYVNYNPGVPL